MQPIVQITAGYYYFMFLTNDGRVYVMGSNNYGQLGIGSTKTTPLTAPVHLSSLQGIPVMQVACGAYHSLVLTVSGNIFSFGKNDFGQLGFGDTDNRSYPMNLKFLNSLKASFISCGEDFTAVLTLVRTRPRYLANSSSSLSPDFGLRTAACSRSARACTAS